MHDEIFHKDREPGGPPPHDLSPRRELDAVLGNGAPSLLAASDYSDRATVRSVVPVAVPAADRPLSRCWLPGARVPFGALEQHLDVLHRFERVLSQGAERCSVTVNTLSRLDKSL